MKPENHPLLTGIGRGAFYALTVTLGIVLMLQQLDAGNITSFRIFVVGVSAIFAVELISGWIMRFHAKKQVQLHLHSSENRNQELLDHLIIPANIYVWTLAFGYFNQQLPVRLAVLIVSFILLTAVFAAMRSFYLDQKKVMHLLHSVFDLSKIYIFFLIVDSILNLTGGNLIWTPVAIALLAFLMNLLMVLRHKKLSTAGVYVNLAASILIAGVIYIGVLVGLTTVIQVSLLALICYYFANATLYHLLHGDLKLNLLAEYALVISLALLILQGLS